MRRRSMSALALALALGFVAVTGCGSDSIPPRPPPRVEWTLTSSDGRFVVEQRREGTSCRVDARIRPDRRLWSSRTCVPPDAVAFLSPDGRRMLVLDAFPARHDGGWSRVAVASLWVDGAVLREYHGADLLGLEAAADTRGQRSWMRGETAEAVRGAAHASPEGDTVQLELADGRTVGLGFDGGPTPVAPPVKLAAVASVTPAAEAAPPPPPTADPPRVERVTSASKPTRAASRPKLGAKRGHRAAPPARASGSLVEPAPPPHQGGAPEALAFDEVGLYRWEDESGALHFGSGSQVPPRLRRRAVPVNSTVGVIPLDRPPAAPAAPAREGAAPPGAAAPGTTNSGDAATEKPR